MSGIITGENHVEGNFENMLDFSASFLEDASTSLLNN